jgi:hypothetical protein
MASTPCTESVIDSGNGTGDWRCGKLENGYAMGVKIVVSSIIE